MLPTTDRSAVCTLSLRHGDEALSVGWGGCEWRRRDRSIKTKQNSHQGESRRFEKGKRNIKKKERRTHKSKDGHSKWLDGH